MKLCLIIIGLITTLAAYSQNQNIHWYSGHGLDNGRIYKWQNNQLTLTDSSEMGTKETSAIVSDADGNLLFYTNGCKVYNRLHLPMLNSDTLPCLYAGWFTVEPGTEELCSGAEASNGALIVNDPSDSNRYYLFTTYTNLSAGQGERFICNVVDMTLDGGLCAFVPPYNRVLDSVRYDRICYKIAGIRHANGRDWWIISPVLDLWLQNPNNQSSTYIHDHYIKRYLLTPSGIVDTGSQSYCYAVSGMNPGEGEIAVTKNGDKLAMCHYNKTVVVMDFDRCTGLISNCRVIDTVTTFNAEDGSYFYSVEFSPDGNLLYASTGEKLYQYNLNDSFPADTRYLVASHNLYTSASETRKAWGHLQRGMDDKIYTTIFKFQYWNYTIVDTPTLWLRRIEYPDSIGPSCNFNNWAFPVDVQILGLPNQVNWNLGALEGSDCDTLTTVSNDLVENKITAHLFPNPATESATLVLNKPAPEQMELVLYDLVGKEVLQVEVPRHQKYVEIKLAAITKGVYFYRLQSIHQTLVNGKLMIE